MPVSISCDQTLEPSHRSVPETIASFSLLANLTPTSNETRLVLSVTTSIPQVALYQLHPDVAEQDRHRLIPTLGITQPTLAQVA